MTYLWHPARAQEQDSAWEIHQEDLQAQMRSDAGEESFHCTNFSAFKEADTRNLPLGFPRGTKAAFSQPSA